MKPNRNELKLITISMDHAFLNNDHFETMESNSISRTPRVSIVVNDPDIELMNAHISE